MPSKKSSAITYQDAGVSIKSADRLVDHLKSINPAIGGFSGLVPLPIKGMKEPVLVASTDGVGTKLLVALKQNKLDTIGIDLVAMSVNDLLVCGARPLFFLDYYATGKLRISQAKAVLTGIVEGCRQAGCPLIGGETAEMPGLYQDGDLDLAGFSVGVLDRKNVVDGSEIQPGDVIIGLSSNGLHSNGYSLARKALGESPQSLRRSPPALGGKTVGEAMLDPTRIYVNAIAALLASGVKVRGMAHITGGGLPGNVNRVLPKAVDAVIKLGSWPVPPIFYLIQDSGPVDEAEMYRTFNMGVGYVVVVRPRNVKTALAALGAAGESAHVIGRIEGDGQGRVRMDKP